MRTYSDTIEDTYDMILIDAMQKMRDIGIEEEYVKCCAIDYLREKSF